MSRPIVRYVLYAILLFALFPVIAFAQASLQNFNLTVSGAGACPSESTVAFTVYNPHNVNIVVEYRVPGYTGWTTPGIAVGGQETTFWTPSFIHWQTVIWRWFNPSTNNYRSVSRTVNRFSANCPVPVQFEPPVVELPPDDWPGDDRCNPQAYAPLAIYEMPDGYLIIGFAVNEFGFERPYFAFSVITDGLAAVSENTLLVERQGLYAPIQFWQLSSGEWQIQTRLLPPDSDKEYNFIWTGCPHQN